MVSTGLGLPVMKESDVDVGDGAPTHHVRTRRCACSTQDDYECHYFCHLDIIWVNTPSKTTVYGLGGALLRRRRSTGRCTCADVRDEACSNFCRCIDMNKCSINLFSRHSQWTKDSGRKNIFLAQIEPHTAQPQPDSAPSGPKVN
uniref:Endothelin-like toxin domain-containing protein n=1 Tax=Oryzias melastigma TaxID=30732 RepID=A0A3B3DCH4_ORYME